jgi:hypothetical protein
MHARRSKQQASTFPSYHIQVIISQTNQIHYTYDVWIKIEEISLPVAFPLSCMRAKFQKGLNHGLNTQIDQEM